MTENYWDAGVTFNGLLVAPARHAWHRLFLHRRVVADHRLQKEQGFPVIPSFEGRLEVSYTAQLMQGLTLQPDFQYFWNPGGHTGNPDDPAVATPNAAVFGLRTTVNY